MTANLSEPRSLQLHTTVGTRPWWTEKLGTLGEKLYLRKYLDT